MKKIAIWMVVLVVVVGGLFYWYATTQASVGSLSIHRGTASIGRSESSTPARTGSSIKINDMVKVGEKSRVSLVLKDSSVVRLEAGSVVEIKNLTYNGKKIKEAVFKLRFGRLWSHVEPLESDASFKVETPTTVAAVRGTSYNTDYLNNATSVFVYKNKVGVSLLGNTLKEKLVEPNGNNYFKLNDSTLVADFSAGPKILDSNLIDDWISFNKKEDDIIDQKAVKTRAKTLLPKPSSTTTTSRKPLSSTEPLVASTPLTSKKVISLLISAPSETMIQGQRMLLKAQLVYSDDTTEDITKKVQWQEDVELGSMSSDGYFYAKSPGKITIVIKYLNLSSNSLTITISSDYRLQ